MAAGGLVAWPDLSDWQRIDHICINGRRVWTARRNGVTWQIVRTNGRWFAVKLKGGRVLGELEGRNIPKATREALEASAGVQRI